MSFDAQKGDPVPGNKKLLNAKDAAEQLGLKYTYLLKLARLGKIPHSRPIQGGRPLFDVDKVLEHWAKNGEKNSRDRRHYA